MTQIEFHLTFLVILPAPSNHSGPVELCSIHDSVALFCVLLWITTYPQTNSDKNERSKKGQEEKSRGTGKSDHLFFPKEVSNIGLLSSCVTFLYSNSFLRLFQIKTPKGFKVLSFFPIPILLPCFTKKKWFNLKVLLKVVSRTTHFITRWRYILGFGIPTALQYMGRFFFSSELNKKGINGLFPFSGRSDLKGAFKTNIKPFQAV